MSAHACDHCGLEFRDDVPHPPDVCRKAAAKERRRLAQAMDGALAMVSLIAKERDEARQALAEIVEMVPHQTTAVQRTRLERARSIVTAAKARLTSGAKP